MSINVLVDAAAADQMLSDVVDRLDDPDPLLRFLADEIADFESEVFATQGLGTWAALHPDTIRAKGSNRVLVDTGDLLADLTRPSSGNIKITGDTVTVSSGEISGVMAQRGARGAPKRNPAPAPPPTTVRQWAEHLLEALAEGTIRR